MLTETALAECGPRLLKRRRQIALLKSPFELLPRFPPRWRGGHQCKPGHILGKAHRIQQCQQTSPGVARNGEPIDPPLPAQLLQIGDLLLPANRHLSSHWGAAAAALVVVDQLPPGGECVEAGEQVIVVGPRTTMKDDDRRAASGPPLEQLHAANLPEPGLYRLRGHDCVTAGSPRRRRLV